MAKAALSRIYSFSTNTADTYAFPLGIKLCLVPEISTILSLDTKVKVDCLRNCHAKFQQHAVSMLNWEVAELDFVQASGDSLRSQIMAIQSTAFPTQSLFHSVDPHWKGNGFVFSFSPTLEDKACTRVTGLLVYL